MTPQELAADIAAELRAHPERWTQGAMWRDKDGIPCVRGDAVACCLFGQMDRRCGPDGVPVSLHESFMRLAGISSVSNFNDKPGRTVADVIALCDAVAGMP